MNPEEPGGESGRPRPDDGGPPRPEEASAPPRIRAIRAHYEPRIATARPHFDILDWASPASQEARFRVLADSVDLRGLSLLDVGCGLGDLRAYLRRRAIDADYTGVDVSLKMVEAALQRQPDGRFLHADVFAAPCPFPPGSFDVVYCSGIFNLDLGNNAEFVPTAVERFLELARRFVVCNMLHKRAGTCDGTYFFFDPAQIVPALRALCEDVRLLDHYLPNDFTVVCRK